MPGNWIIRKFTNSLLKYNIWLADRWSAYIFQVNHFGKVKLGGGGIRQTLIFSVKCLSWPNCSKLTAQNQGAKRFFWWGVGFFLKSFSTIGRNRLCFIYNFFQHDFETDLYPLDQNRFSAIIKILYSIVLHEYFHEYYNKNHNINSNTNSVTPDHRLLRSSITG